MTIGGTVGGGVTSGAVTVAEAGDGTVAVVVAVTQVRTTRVGLAVTVGTFATTAVGVMISAAGVGGDSSEPQPAISNNNNSPRTIRGMGYSSCLGKVACMVAISSTSGGPVSNSSAAA